jgi:CubicO group peptidase (beta-lactamase class C family)
VLRKQGVVAGHAGLFSTAQDLLRFAQMLINNGELEGHRYFEPATIELMHTNQLHRLKGKTGLGWELDLGDLPAAAKSHQVFGKTGFTGCAIQMDPVAKIALIYLSNRTYPNRPTSKEPIRAFRRQLANLVFG